MKKLIVVFVMVALLLASVSLSAFAAEGEVKSLLVFGDSISTGYGLDGSLYTRPSYANTVAKTLALKQGAGYVNYAVDGDTSADILQIAKSRKTQVAEADLILLTCGGNDVLGKMLSIALSASGATSGNLLYAIRMMATMTTADINARLYSEANEAIIDNALKAYRANMKLLVAYLKETAPDARIVFLTQYNPLSGLVIAPVLDAYAEDVIGRLNVIMTEEVGAGGCELVDTHAVMVGKGTALSNITSGDIHPNAQGHAAMAEMIVRVLGLSAPGSSETSMATTLPMTTTLPQVTTIVTTPGVSVTTAVPITTPGVSVTTAATQTATTRPSTAMTVTTPATSVTTTEPVTTTAVTTAVLIEPTETTTSVTATTAATTTTATATTAETAAEPNDIPIGESKSSTVPMTAIVAIPVIAVGAGVTAVALVIRKKRT